MTFLRTVLYSCSKFSKQLIFHIARDSDWRPLLKCSDSGLIFFKVDGQGKIFPLDHSYRGPARAMPKPISFVELPPMPKIASTTGLPVLTFAQLRMSKYSMIRRLARSASPAAVPFQRLLISLMRNSKSLYHGGGRLAISQIPI